MPFSSYLNRNLMSLLFGGVSYTIPTTVYVGLSTTTPDGTGTAGTGGFTEVSGNAYARQSIANSTAGFGSAVASSVNNPITRSNANLVSFPQATGSWGTVTHVGLFDALTGGNLLAWGQLSSPNAISSGDTASFAINQLTFQLS